MVDINTLELHINHLHSKLLKRPAYHLQTVPSLDLLKQDLKGEMKEVNEQINNNPDISPELKKKAEELNELYRHSQYYID